ncbi:PD-(D/E)XK nuclease family protein, partial [Campylobacter sp. MIT 97-5078]
FLKEENEELQSLIKQELLFLKQLNKDHKLTLKELFELFFMKINSLNLSSVGGGEVTVMGLLESRGLEFKGVIIVDFNDDLIPKRSVNELFLNNEVRARAGLISYEKRENLQRFYYERLIKNAEKVAISYVENEEKIPSRLLDELDIRQVLDRTYSNKAYIKALSFDYEPAKIDLVPIKAPVLKHNIFKNSLSFTRLKTFLEQKRTYYYKYILELKEARALSLTSNAFEKGTLIHELLEQYYEAHARHFDYEQFTHLLDEKANCISRLDKELLKIQFKHFAKYENEHFKQGFCIIELEKDIRANYEFKGLSIDINGKIDRIDESKDMILIIDYKSGKVPDNSYQLAFYQALFKATYKKDAKAVYYDLSKTMSFTEGEKTKSLEELENELINLSKLNQPISFENKKTNFCPYAALYEKDLK